MIQEKLYFKTEYNSNISKNFLLGYINKPISLENEQENIIDYRILNSSYSNITNINSHNYNIFIANTKNFKIINNQFFNIKKIFDKSKKLNIYIPSEINKNLKKIQANLENFKELFEAYKNNTIGVILFEFTDTLYQSHKKCAFDKFFCFKIKSDVFYLDIEAIKSFKIIKKNSPKQYFYSEIEKFLNICSFSNIVLRGSI